MFESIKHPITWWRAASRRRRAFVAVPLVLLLAGGVALAALLFRAPLTGDVTVQGEPQLQWSTESGDAPTSTASHDNVTCDATVISADELQVTFSGFGGQECAIVARVTTDSTETLQVQDLKWTSSGDDIQAWLADGCQRQLGGDSGTTKARVDMHFMIKEGTSAGTVPADGSAGVYAALGGEHDPAACPDTAP